ncbi:hypothetical protein PGTUg99_012425 [Puccinia graminis f. sp. tritici]|uniref:DNA 3'-5' helicase n=1 Tax=Puccinia graminis f. sp. tritici TaxID=56615 RepID=A0A5B0RJ81_PUCGR|nr:hypothetical protein PGTUg99_012425 [Puccinia graminis f. sp. tritici]
MTLIEMIPVKPKANKLPEDLGKMEEALLSEHITTRSVELYQDQPKKLQVAAVSSLVRGGHTFVRAGTGYGKTRISEMYFGLFEKKVVVLVLVPLDSLGDDQVREKKLVNISAINLNKMTLNWASIREIKQGKFSFVYLAILGLIVVDEAHMVYLWGLVASKHSKTLIIFARLEDQAIFRPAYGHIGTRLMATDNVPILLLSATCRPEAVSAITSCLMLQPGDLSMIDGELTRPEIRFIRVYMESTLSSCDDLLRIFAPHTTTPAKEAVPMIIYSGTRNRTFQVMRVVNEARDTPKHEYDPLDGFIRRYHAVTGDDDKQRTISDYGEGAVPVISATMALGLGQNLKRVRCVIHMGRGDPAAIVQMVGRCGRDGNVGLGLLFMEPTRKNGRNDVSEFGPGRTQDDDGRMDALAVTKCCLRIALTLDNKIGYIPLTNDDPEVKTEKAREEALGFAACQCSNCQPEEATALMNVIQQANIQNFDNLLMDPSSIAKDPTILTMTRKRKQLQTKGTCSYPTGVRNDLVQHLVHEFEAFYSDLLGPHAEFPASVFFGLDQAMAVVGSIDQIRAGNHHDTDMIEKLIGGQCFPGQLVMLDQAIFKWVGGVFYKSHLQQTAELDRFIEAEGIRVRAEMADELAALQLQAEARRKESQMAKMLAKAAEKARVAEAKCAARLAVAEDKAREKQLLAAEKAAEKVRQAAKKKATLDRAAARAATKQHTAPGLGPGTTLDIDPGTHKTVGNHTSPIYQDIVEVETHSLLQQPSGRAEARVDNELEDEQKKTMWADRRVNADAKRAADERIKSEGRRNRREAVENKSDEGRFGEGA